MRNVSLKKALTPAIRNLLIVLLLLEAGLGALHALTRSPDTSPFLARAFNLDAEFTFGAMLSSALFLSVGVIAFVNGILVSRENRGRQIFWWVAGVLFVFLAQDEYFSIHEGILAPTPGGSGPWVIIYAIAGFLLFIGALVAYRFAFRGETNLFAVTLVGLGVMGMSGLGLEALNFLIFCDAGPLHRFVRNLVNRSLCHAFPGLEETIEMMGISIVLAAFLSHAQTYLDKRRWQLARRVVGGAVALWLAVLVGQIWLLPPLESRLAGDHAEVTYLDGDLALVGYRLSHKVANPGDTLTLRLYWQAQHDLPSDYFVSAHVVTRPDAQSEAQADRPLGGWLGWRSSSWLPGVTMRDVMRISLPDNLDTPESYWVILRIWYPTERRRDGTPVFETAERIEVGETDRQLLEDDTLALTSFPVLSEDAVLPPPPVEIAFQFEDGITLVGYEMPDSGRLGESLSVEFWWTAGQDVGPELVQFVHLFHANGEDFIVYDQPPFGGSFPTSDWPARMQATDTLEVPLPADAPPGEYSVHTGLYSLENGERRPVTDGDGQPVVDNSIDLGTVTLEP